MPPTNHSDSISTYLNESMELVKDVDTILTTIKVWGGIGGYGDGRKEPDQRIKQGPDKVICQA